MSPVHHKIPAGEMFGQAFYTSGLRAAASEPRATMWDTSVCSEHGLKIACLPRPAAIARRCRPTAPAEPRQPAGTRSLVQLPPRTGPRLTDHRLLGKVDYTRVLAVHSRRAPHGRDLPWPGGRSPSTSTSSTRAPYRGTVTNSLCPTRMPASRSSARSTSRVGAAPFARSPRASTATLCCQRGHLVGEGQHRLDARTAETVYWADRIMEPLYEAHTGDRDRRAGEPPRPRSEAVNTMTDAERTYYSFAGAIKMTDQATAAYEPLFTITQEDINALGVEGEPQQGSITIAEFKEKGCYKTQRSEGDALTYRPFEAFIADPVANPAATASGKFRFTARRSRQL
ncbi:MAG: hypothetical protein ACLTDR_14705 [Adlercreutzia equolifaciens]